jgi:hypothetical protein
MILDWLAISRERRRWNMADPTPKNARSPRSEPRHEQTDVRLRSVVLPGLALGGIILILSITSWWMLNVFAARPLQPDVALSPLAQMPQVPPTPRLQEHPAKDMTTLNAAYSEMLNSYGWVDKAAGRVRIPIERAKDMLLQESQAGHNFGANAGGNPATYAPLSPLNAPPPPGISGRGKGTDHVSPPAHIGNEWERNPDEQSTLTNAGRKMP